MRKLVSVLLMLVALNSIMLVETTSQSNQPKDGGWDVKPVEIAAPNAKEGSGELRKVRAGKHTGYDRVVFEFSGKSVPMCKVRYAEPPFNLGESDEVVKISGEAFLEVGFTPAAAHNLETGQITVVDPEKPVRSNALQEVKRIYDHEGQVIYVLGLIAQRQFRVQTLSNPSRLVVDIKH